MGQGINEIFPAVLDFLIPPVCLACGEKVLKNGGLCHSCWQELMFIEKPFCKICGLKLPEYTSEGMECVDCLQDPPSFNAARSALKYNGTAAHLIARFKYKDRTENYKILSHWIEMAAGDLIKESDVIMPVPLHRIRLFARGYNQSALLARKIAENADKQYSPQVLKRIKLRPPQASLGRDERINNVSNVFAVNQRHRNLISDKIVAVVDDVMTTGATLNEIAKILCDAGAKKVYCLTIARTHI
jgi:ComF family protein